MTSMNKEEQIEARARNSELDALLVKTLVLWPCSTSILSVMHKQPMKHTGRRLRYLLKQGWVCRVGDKWRVSDCIRMVRNGP